MDYEVGYMFGHNQQTDLVYLHTYTDLAIYLPSYDLRNVVPPKSGQAISP